MSNKNYQDIINRIYEIYKELGISAGDSSNTPSEDSIKSTAEKILNNLISNPANSVGESIEVIKNKVLQIKSNTESVNNYLAPLKQKFDNIYNELNSTSSSYMKGKVNGIYSTVLDIYNILFSTGSDSIEQSLENLKDRGKFTYYGRAAIRDSVSYGNYLVSSGRHGAHRSGVIILSPSITNDTTLEIDGYNYYYDFRFDENTYILGGIGKGFEGEYDKGTVFLYDTSSNSFFRRDNPDYPETKLYNGNIMKIENIQHFTGRNFIHYNYIDNYLTFILPDDDWIEIFQRYIVDEYYDYNFLEIHDVKVYRKRK